WAAQRAERSGSAGGGERMGDWGGGGAARVCGAGARGDAWRDFAVRRRICGDQRLLQLEFGGARANDRFVLGDARLSAARAGSGGVSRNRTDVGGTASRDREIRRTEKSGLGGGRGRRRARVRGGRDGSGACEGSHGVF